jgi:hypothetical protein
VALAPVANIHATHTTTQELDGGEKLALVAVPEVPLARWVGDGVEESSAIATAVPRQLATQVTSPLPLICNVNVEETTVWTPPKSQ